MAIEGYVEYRRREYCIDVQCPVQVQLSELAPGSEQYEQTRQTCQKACVHTTYEFHHWLIEHGYLLLKPETLCIKPNTKLKTFLKLMPKMFLPI